MPTCLTGTGTGMTKQTVREAFVYCVWCACSAPLRCFLEMNLHIVPRMCRRTRTILFTYRQLIEVLSNEVWQCTINEKEGRPARQLS